MNSFDVNSINIFEVFYLVIQSKAMDLGFET